MRSRNGCNIDSLETIDERQLIPRTGFSIEPGNIKPATVKTFDDHRLAMTFAFAGREAAQRFQTQNVYGPMSHRTSL
jgi:hypothetical protein